jgi:hypothetical protein
MAKKTLKTKVKIKSNIQDYIKSMGLLPRGKVQTFYDIEVARLADPYVPSDTTALRKSVFTQTNFGSGLIKYLIYGNKDGRNTWNDTTSKFQDAPKRGPFWVIRMFNEGGREKLLLALKRFFDRK